MITTWEDYTTTLSDAMKMQAERILRNLQNNAGEWVITEDLVFWCAISNARTLKKIIQYLRDQGHFIMSSQKGYCYYDPKVNGPIEPGSEAWKFLEACREMAYRHGATYLRMRDSLLAQMDGFTAMHTASFDFPMIDLPEIDK